MSEEDKFAIVIAHTRAAGITIFLVLDMGLWTFPGASTSSSEYQPSRESTSPSVINPPLSYASHASSEDVAPDGSDATNPSLDIYEEIEATALEMASSTYSIGFLINVHCATAERQSNGAVKGCES